MRFAPSLYLTASFALSALATPTIYLAGDSTMAKNGANDGSTDGPHPSPSPPHPY